MNSLDSKEIQKLIPQELLEPSTLKAIRTLFTSTLYLGLGIFMLAKFPWYLLPIGWLYTGIVASGLFAVGYACSEGKFFKNQYINEITGTISMAPLLYPFQSWKKSHRSEVVHKVVDSDFWVFGSLLQWLKSNIYYEINTSLILNHVGIYLFSSIVFGLIIYFKGVWGLWKYYIMPLINYHIVVSIFLKMGNEAKKKNDLGFVDLPTFIAFIRYLCNECYNVYSFKLKELSENETIVAQGEKLKERISELVPSYNFSKVKNELQKKMGEKYETLYLNFEILKNFFKNDPQIDWTITLFLLITPIMAIYGIVTTPFNWKTYLLGFIFYYLGGIGITMGYHRLWSHRSFDAHWSVEFILLILGSSTFEGSVFSWCNDHRIHHRYTDTEKDPYNIKRSFFYAHIGWLFYYRDYDDSFIRHDLKKNALLRFQHKYYAPISLILGFFMPMTVCGLVFGDWWGGFFIAGVAKSVFLMHCTFCINSVAHYVGEATFADERTPRDSWFVSLFTFGEGYHNFHHEFPFDYRNGLHFYDYDPGKWLISICHFVGLAYNLKKFDPQLFDKGKIQMQEKKILEKKSKFYWGPNKESLPIITMDEFNRRSKSDNLILVDGYVYNVTQFKDKHPGGKGFISAYIGKDASKEFNGTIYNHSTAARNILDTIAESKIK
eukprot:gene12360-6028_t